MLGPDFADKLAADLAAEDDPKLRICNDGRFLRTTRRPFATRNAEFNPEEFATRSRYQKRLATEPDTPFDTSFNFGFDFGPTEEFPPLPPRTRRLTPQPPSPPPNSTPSRRSCSSAPPTPRPAAPPKSLMEGASRHEGFRKPGEAATLPELIKFLNDRSGYIRALEDEATPESFSRIENLKELANAAQDAQERGES
jgi:DNA helicase-2/ATP-dependent DNA helicase PcrA